jgi:hypothetical protein
MGPARKHELDKRLADYSATLRSSRLEETRKRRSGNWQVYAAVTGSALAMATNASAGTISIINSSLTGNVTAGPLPNVSNLTRPPFTEYQSQSIQLTNGKGSTIHVGFGIGVGQGAVDGGQRASAVLLGGSQVGFLHNSTGAGAFFVKDLASATKTSNHTGVFKRGTNFLATQLNFSFAGVDPVITYGWPKSATGFAAFSFTYGGKPDYGWVQLRYTVGTNGLIDEIEAEGSSASREPSTFALALLAAGAAGVAALRRRRKAAA